MIETMYPAAVNSRQTELAEAIDDTQTSFTVLDGSVLPPAPNLITLGTDESAETVLYTGKTGNEITGVTRGFESGAKAWAVGTKLARYFTAYDHNTFKGNIADLDKRLNNIPAPQDASLTDKGIVQLSNKTDGTSESVAATEKAVKEAYDRGSAGVTTAQAAQTIINNRDGYGTTTNSGNTYAVTLTPAPAAYADGLRITIKINAANTGAVTINVNGLGAKSVLKSNGSAMTANSLRANSVYSLVYNGTNFILQGEGGEYGTAVAGDVRSTKTLGTDSGIVTGSLITRNTSETIVVPGETDQVLPSGIYDFPITVVGRVAKKYATGLITSPTAAIQFPNFNDINYGAYPLLVTGLTFRPTVVVVTRQVLGTRDVSTYTFAFNNGSPNESGTTFNYCSVLNTAQGNILEFIKINEYTGTGSNARGYMNDTSFRLPVTVAGVSYRWEAFG